MRQRLLTLVVVTPIGATAALATAAGVPVLAANVDQTAVAATPLIDKSCGNLTITLSPASDSTFVGLKETLTATVMSNKGQAMKAMTATFTVTSGPNKGLTGQNPTDGKGHATFVYSSSKTGTDSIIATTCTALSNTSNITWKQTPPPPVPELPAAIAAPLVGALLMGGLVLGSVVRRRARHAVS